MEEAVFNRRSIVLVVVVLLIGLAVPVIVVGQSAQWPAWDMRDGDYRGHFDDREHNVSVQIRLENQEIVAVSLRWAYYRGVDYRAADDDPVAGIYQQHVEALEYLIGARGVQEIVERTTYMEGSPSGPALNAISTQDVDGFTAATIRSGKIGSAVRDALNRGRYRP
ncbi:MAG: FMN-binding protein [Spirochaetaceae bacterium]|nr:MAG: FMN-binding protein [Spirochaetaceae bacterium]